MGDYTTAGDRLWTAVMENEIAAHGNLQGKKWRTVNKQTVACDSCKDSGTSVLLRCGHEKCPREFHIDCAFHQGGLTLDDNGVLNVFCESHFKALVFCSCKEPYDDARPMVFCDECCDWFHNKCEGLTANEAASIDKYTCKNCREILRQGRSVSKVIKEKNMAKENRSVHQQSASKAVGLLAELEGGLCPIIDEIGTKGKSQWAIKDIEDAKSVVCAPPFTVSPGAEMNEMDAQSAELLNKLGVMPVVDAWRTQLVRYLDHYAQWRTDTESYFTSNIHRIVPQYGPAQLPVMEELRRAFVGFSERASAELVGIPVDLEGFAIFLDCLNWMIEFLQLLHQSPKADNWIPSVGSCLRAGAARYKHLVAHHKDFFCGAFAEVFQTYHKTASAQVSAMGVWYNETYKILSTEMDYTLTDLDAYLRSADDFPARPLLYDELSTVVAEAWEVEQEILSALSNPATTAEQLTQLTLKKSELGVALPSELKLSAASDRHVYLSAYAMAMNQGRLRRDLAVSLIDKARVMLNGSPAGATDKEESSVDVSDGAPSSTAVPSVESVLYQALGEQVQQVVASLQQLLDAADTVVQGLLEQLQKWHSADDFSSAAERLTQLRALRIIAPEEELLEFIQNAKALQEEVQRSVPHLTALSSENQGGAAQQWTPLSTVQRLVSQIEAALRNTVVDQFELSHKHKTALSKLLTSLVDQQEAAERLWTVVANAVQDCERGVPVTQEALRDAITQAEASHIKDEGVAQRAGELLQRAVTDEARYLRTLEGICDASEESVRTARTMLEEAKFLPLTATGAQRIAQRSTVCTAVFESQRILTQSSSTNSAALSEREMHTVRELSHTINKLSTAALVSPESDLLSSIKEPILLFLWRAEVHFLWLHPIAPAAAEQIRAHGEKLGDAARGFPEWAELNAEIQRGEAFLQAAQSVIAEVEQCKVQFNSDLTGWQEASGPLEEKLRALVTEDATLRIKTQSITTALTENLDLLATLRSAQATLTAVRAEMASESTSTRPVVDFRAITYYTNQLSSLAEKHASFSLLLTRKEEMSSIHSAASRWNESASVLLPQQMATRHKVKPEASQVTLPQVLARLAEPIARAVSTPMHEKFKALLADVDAFRVGFMTFLLPPDFPIKDSSNFQSPDFSAKLQEDMITIGEMKRLAENIPLDLPEFRVLQWVSALFEWISSIPYPGDDPKQHAVPMDQALKKVEESEPIVGTIPGNVIDTLCRLGVMNLDESAGPVGFHANIHPYFNLAGDLSEHLEQQVKHSEQLQLRIKQAIDTKRPAKELLQLQEESAGLLVQMSAPIRRALDRTLGKSGVRGSGAQRSGEAYESESSEYSDREEEEEVEADNYWSEKTVPKAKSSKRARDTDSLVSVKRAEPSARAKGEEKPVKKSRSLCTNPDCPTAANKARGSLYCGNHCAMVTAPQVFSALLHYRKLLCLYGSVQRRLISAEDPNGTLDKVSDADYKAFTTAVPAAHEASADMVAGMKSAGFIAESQNPSRPTPNRSGDALETFLQDGEHRARLQSHSAAENVASPAGDRKTSYIHSFLSALPPAAGPVFLRGDAEGLTQHNAAVKAAGGTPVSVGAGSKHSASTGASLDEDLRLKIRYGLEELLERTLSRLQVAGAASHAASIALDFEDELCLKYATAESKASKKGLVFDKKEYRKHYLMLVSNLRKTHNDQLIMKLVSNEISLESLLEMTAVQLADSSTQQRRQQQLTNVVQDALRESTQETLEAARRQVMGTESENSVGLLASAQEVSDAQRASLSSASAEDLPPSPKHSLKMGGSLDPEDQGGMDVATDYGDANDGAVSPHVSTVSSRSLEIEQKVLGATSAAATGTGGYKPKRPIDADAITRMTTSSFKPNKAPRLENSDGTESSSTPRGGMTSESPRAKPTALLGSILSNKAAVAAATASPKTSGDGYHFEDISTAATLRASIGSSSIRSTALPKLITSTGGHEISIVRPAHGSGAKNIVMKGEAVVGDRKLQGILTSPCNIDGRVKLDEFKRIINKLLAILEDPRTVNLPNRKLLSVFKMTVQPDVNKDGSTSYDSFCTEFTRDLRVGYCNPGNGNSQVYVLPPAHKNCLPIFQCLDDGTSDSEKNVLYCVLTSKDHGPEQYTQEEDLAPGGFSWDAPSVSGPELSTSSAASSSGIAAMNKGSAPPPPAPPSGLKKPSTSAGGVPPPVPPPMPPRTPVSGSTSAASTAGPTATTAPATTPASVTTATPPVPAPAPPAADPIQRVAVFVATRGIQMMRELQAKPETRSVMPFLFDNHPDHSKFLLALKAAMEQKNAPK